MTTETVAPPPELTTKAKVLRPLAWGALGLIALVVFTVVKISDVKVKNTLVGYLNSFAAPYGLTVAAQEAELTLLTGPGVTLTGVTVSSSTNTETPVRFDSIKVSPAVLALLTGKLGGKAVLRLGQGELTVMAAQGTNDAEVQVHAYQFDLGKTGALPLIAKVRGSAVIQGDISLSGNFSKPETLSGTVGVQLTQVAFERQSLYGFDLPALNISEIKSDLESKQGKVSIKTLKVGKSDADDLQANVTGDLTLGREMGSTALNLKADFGFSKKVLQSFGIIDALLMAGKKGEGKYAYQLSGTLSAPQAVGLK